MKPTLATCTFDLVYVECTVGVPDVIVASSLTICVWIDCYLRFIQYKLLRTPDLIRDCFSHRLFGKPKKFCKFAAYCKQTVWMNSIEIPRFTGASQNVERITLTTCFFPRLRWKAGAWRVRTWNLTNFSALKLVWEFVIFWEYLPIDFAKPSKRQEH